MGVTPTKSTPLPTPVSPADFDRLRAYLMAPPRQVVSASQWLEWLLPHDPLPDSSFPAPDDISDVEVMMSWFDLAPRILCLLTAAEMVMVAWYEWAAREHSGDGRDLPGRLIARVREWLEGDAELAELDDDAARVRSLATMAADVSNDPVYGMNPVEIRAARAASNAARAAYSVVRAISDDEFSDAAVHYASLTAPTPTVFLARWWDRCRCRLAVADPFAFELQ